MVSILLLVFGWVVCAAGGSLKDIKHVVLFMQENRSFDHYFGTMAGVRGFADPNVQVNPSGLNAFQQVVDSSLSNATKILAPWYAPYLGGDWTSATQCMPGGSNLWSGIHGAYAGGSNDHWALKNSPYSMAYFKRQDVPVHFGIAEAFTVGDMYQHSVMSSTDPNRVFWNSGTINIPEGPQTPSEGGPTLQNSDRTPGCVHKNQNLDCWPLTWTTIVEHIQNAGISWQFFQNDKDMYADNILRNFPAFDKAKAGNPLYDHGTVRNASNSLAAFYQRAKDGTLPQVSWIIGDQELSEHTPWQPKDGGWLQKQVVEAITLGKSFNDTALIISYDEGGGWFDHVTPYHSPTGTPGEWIEDPWTGLGQVFAGPGYRVPFYIISPWTSGGHVFTEHADHASQIMFLEQWAQTSGYNLQTKEINSWRREKMSNLVKAFNFSNASTKIPLYDEILTAAQPNFTVPSLPNTQEPLKDKSGNHIGMETCQAEHPRSRPPVPYTNQAKLSTEQGFKSVRGQLTEGRFLTFEMGGYALALPSGANALIATPATRTHITLEQRWILHQLESGGNAFNVASAESGRYIANVTINDMGNGAGYSLGLGNEFIGICASHAVCLSGKAAGFNIYSVTYQ